MVVRAKPRAHKGPLLRKNRNLHNETHDDCNADSATRYDQPNKLEPKVYADIEAWVNRTPCDTLLGLPRSPTAIHKQCGHNT